MKFETITYEANGHIGLLSFNRPHALNALNLQMMNEFMSFLESLHQDKNLRCLVLTGHGEKSFIAGADIKEMSEFTVEQAKAFSKLGHQILLKLQSLPIPIIASVNGFALGGGCEMALACDFIIASHNAIFGLPEVGLGLIPGFGGTQRLAKFVGLPKACELIFTGRKFTAEEALVMGLIAQVTSPGELDTTALLMAKEISARAPIAIRQAKETILRGFHLSLKEGLELEAEAFAKLFSTQDRKEGLTSFIEKRKPSFQNH